MRMRNVLLLTAISVTSACVSIPKETITLSQALGNDLQELHNSHRASVEIYYNKVKENINYFIDDVYAPFIFNYSLKSEFERYRKGDTSLFKTIEIAGRAGGKTETENALNMMLDFQTAAYQQIESKRYELLTPITKQETDIISTINHAYENAIYANSTITGYLKSVSKVKETQQDALSLVGLIRADTVVTNALVKLSEGLDQAIVTGKKIDIASDDAYIKIDSISNKIKKLTSKN
jgi:hypothetical protein